MSVLYVFVRREETRLYLTQGHRWYTASLDVPASESVGVDPSVRALPSDPPPPKRARIQKPVPEGSGSLPNASGSNPYSMPNDSANHRARVNRRSPPYYAPGSPPPGPQSRLRRDARPTIAGEPQVNGSSDVMNGYDPPSGGIAPPASSAVARDQTSGSYLDFGVRPTDQVSENDALHHAMTAQYWAGYWMGVARSKSSSNDVVSPARDMQADGSGEREQSTTARNVLITRQQYYQPAVEHLRR